jgi:hypothetical protein
MQDVISISPMEPKLGDTVIVNNSGAGNAVVAVVTYQL